MHQDGREAARVPEEARRGHQAPQLIGQGGSSKPHPESRPRACRRMSGRGSRGAERARSLAGGRLPSPRHLAPPPRPTPRGAPRSPADLRLTFPTLPGTVGAFGGSSSGSWAGYGGTWPPKVRAAAQLPRVTFPLCALPAPPPALDALPGGRVSVRIVLAVFRLPFPRHKVMRRSSQERIPFPVCTSRARVRSHQQIWAGLGALVARS